MKGGSVLSETARDASAAATVLDANPVSTGRPRILLVEGDGFTRVVLLLRLRLAGFNVDFTSNGILGLGKLRSCHPDVLLVELKLCGLSGLELIRAARAEPEFSARPIYVFTHADRMNRATRKEVGSLATKVFDKKIVSREELVQTFSKMFLASKPADAPSSSQAATTAESEALIEQLVPGEIEAIVAGVQDQSERLAKEGASRDVQGRELLSRVSSLTSCAEAARFCNLARQSKALESFLTHLRAQPQSYTPAALSTITKAVDLMSGIAAESANRRTNELSRFSAVVADESSSSAQAVQRALLEAGFEPACFGEPAPAREYLASNPTDLIIINLRLPEAHGLALADIREMPLHAQTPILLGPEAPAPDPRAEALPTSAPRMESEPLLLAELVLNALNEVQSSRAPVHRHAVSKLPVSEPGRPSSAGPSAVASVSFEDGFELFGAPARQEQSPLAVLPQTDSESAPEIHQPLSWSKESLPGESIFEQSCVQPAAHSPEDYFPPGNLSGLPACGVEPEIPDRDHEAESSTRVEALVPIAGSQMEERPIETLPHCSAQPQGLQPLAEDPAAAAWLANAAGESPQVIAAADLATDTDRAEPASVPDTAAATPNYEESMNHQLEAVSPGQMEQSAEARCAELEQELAALRQAFDDFNGSFGQQQQAALEAGQHAHELEQSLAQSAAELEKQREDRAQEQAELQRQLASANAASAQSQVARQEAEARCAQLEQELAALRQSQAELATPGQKPAAQAPAQSHSIEPGEGAYAPGATAVELEQQVRQNVAALARATAELAKERGERQRSEQRAAEMNGRLQTLHEDLKRALQAQREDQARISALEEQERQMRQEIEQRAAELEQQQDERRLAEEQLAKAQEVNAELRKDLSFYEGANKQFDGAHQKLQSRLEANLNAVREKEARFQQENAERQRLATDLEKAQGQLQNESRKRETLEKELQAAQDALNDREARLQKEAAERQRLKEALDSLQQNSLGNSDRDLELSKLQSALQQEQIERKHQETQLARVRRNARDAAQAARALRTSLRRQIREPVDNVVHSARSLLELETGEEQRKLAEAVLQDVLLVQTRLREPEPVHPAPPEEATSSNTPSA